MYLDLKEHFWWTCIKKDIAEYVAVCDVCQRVKAEHQKPAGLLQPMSIPEWKWDKLGMDFITGLPRTRSGYDSIWVLVVRLTKVAHFIPVKTTYTSAKLSKIYLDLKEHFWWTGMKKDIAESVAVCDVCKRVKAEHQKPAGLLQPMPTPEWKWINLAWTLSPDYPRLKQDMIPYG